MHSMQGQPSRKSEERREQRVHNEENDYIECLNERYLLGDTTLPPQTIKQQLELLLQCKTSEVEALRVHRDELRLMSLNRPNQQPIKVSLAILKDKAKTEEKIWDTVNYLIKNCKDLTAQTNLLEQYLDSTKGMKKLDDVVIIDTGQSQRLLIDNLEYKTQHFLAQLNEQDNKNSLQIRTLQKRINDLRITIFQKQDFLKHLRSKICSLHMKVNARLNRQTYTNILCNEVPSQSQQFVGNDLVRQFSKYLRDPNPQSSQLIKIVVLYIPKENSLFLRCVYTTGQGMVHDIQQKHNRRFKSMAKKNKKSSSMRDGLSSTARVKSAKHIKKKDQYIDQPQLIEIHVHNIISMKVCMVNKIVGFEFKVRGQLGERTLVIGKVKASDVTNSKLVAIGRKQIVSLATYWYQNNMVGVGFEMKNPPKQHFSPMKSQRSFSGLHRQSSLRNILGATNGSQCSIRRKSLKNIHKNVPSLQYYGDNEGQRGRSKNKINTSYGRLPHTFHTEAYRSEQFSTLEAVQNDKTQHIPSRIRSKLKGSYANPLQEYYNY